MAGDKYTHINSNGVLQEYSSAQTSSGASAGQLVALNGSTQVDSSLLPAIAATYTQRTDTGNFSALYNNLEQVDLSTANANVTATLPDATTHSGQGLLVQVITTSASHHIAFATVSSQTINGSAASSLAQLVNVDQTYFFVSDGTNWWTISPVTDLANNVTGTLKIANGGTGGTTAPSNGQLLVGNGSTAYAPATPTSSDSTVTWTLGAGSISAQVNQGNLSLSSIGGSLNLATQVGTSILPANNSSGAISVTANEAISAGAIIHFRSDGKIENADNTDGTKPAHGFSIAAISSGASGTVVMGNGPNTGLSGLTRGTTYFLGTTGGVTSTPPSTTGNNCQVIGVAQSTSEIQVLIGPVYIRG